MLDPRELRDEGIHVILPWDKLFLYDLRVQSLTETYNAISNDGVNLNATLNIRFRLQHDSIPLLHQVIGPNYTKSARPADRQPDARGHRSIHAPSRSIRRRARKFRRRSVSSPWRG